MFFIFLAGQRPKTTPCAVFFLPMVTRARLHKDSTGLRKERRPVKPNVCVREKTRK